MVRFALATLAVCLLLAASSFAAVITPYDSQASFYQALVKATSMDIFFNSLAPTLNSYSDFSDANGYLDPSGVRFVGNNNPGNFLSVEYNNNYNLNGGAVMRLAYYFANSYTTVTFPQPVTAVGFDAYTFNPRGGTFVISFPVELNVAPMTFQVTATPGSSTFIGFASDTPFSSITLQTQNAGNNGAQGVIDNFQAGQVSDTPELTTMLMIGCGLLALKSTSSVLRRVV